MKYPLQKELEKDLSEAYKLLSNVQINGDSASREIAQKYLDAINRINDICVNRNRY